LNISYKNLREQFYLKILLKTKKAKSLFTLSHT